MSDPIAPCPGRLTNGWDVEHECQTCRRRIRPDGRVPALKPQPEPCGNWLPMPGVEYVD